MKCQCASNMKGGHEKLEREIKELSDKVEDHETRITQMESQMDGLGGRVDSLERWVPLLIQDNKDTLKFVNERLDKSDQKLDKAIEENKTIVREASGRVPKWAMWLYGSISGLLIMAIIAGAGWVCETIIFHLH